jgi:putative ATP-binding cassette transporter
LLTFARVLMVSPRFVFLDRMDSDFSQKQLSFLYRLLEEAGISYLSVGDRHTLFAYHDTVLEILGDGRWQTTEAHTFDSFMVIP